MLWMTKVKVCGITNLFDAQKAVELGVDAVGFIFYPKSLRSVDKDIARAIIRELPPFVVKVGVFVDEDVEVVREIQSYCGLTALQFHGDETEEYCAKFNNVIKAFRIRDKSGLDVVKGYEPYVSAVLFDTYNMEKVGGTGEAFDWSVLDGFCFGKSVILSGGITEDNVVSAIDRVRPYAVDSASGTEKSPGKKDYAKMKRLISKVKEMI